MPEAGDSMSEPASQRDVDALNTRARHALVVDDDDQVAEVIAEALRMAGYIAERARDGVQALALANDRRLDIAVIDLLIPGLMQGEELARVLAGIAIRVLMMSGAADVEERLKALPYPYLLKPFRMATLFELVESMRGGTETSGAAR